MKVMRSNLRQLWPQIAFWLLTIMVTHYMTKVSNTNQIFKPSEYFRAIVVKLSRLNTFTVIHPKKWPQLKAIQETIKILVTQQVQCHTSI